MSFADIEWRGDGSFRLHGIDFVVEQHLDGGAPPGAVRFYKPRPMVERYQRFFERHPIRPVSCLFEIGIYFGGSIVFWSEILAPATHIAIDYLRPDDTAELDGYIASRNGRTISAHWGIDQADREALRSIVRQQGVEPIDLVIDDASHKYRQTVAAFNALFPLLRPGGLYIIEDWGWSFDDVFLTANPAWRSNTSLAGMVLDLHELMARRPDVVRSISSTADFVAVERGPGPAHELEANTVVEWNRASRWRRRLKALRSRRIRSRLRR